MLYGQSPPLPPPDLSEYIDVDALNEVIAEYAEQAREFYGDYDEFLERDNTQSPALPETHDMKATKRRVEQMERRHETHSQFFRKGLKDLRCQDSGLPIMELIDAKSGESLGSLLQTLYKHMRYQGLALVSGMESEGVTFELKGATKTEDVREGHFFNIQTQSQACWANISEWTLEYCYEKAPLLQCALDNFWSFSPTERVTMLEQLMDASDGVYGVRVPPSANTARYNRLEQAEKLRIDAEHLQFLQGLGAVSLDWIVLDDTKKAEKRASSVGLPKEMSRMQREAEQQAKKAAQQAKKAEASTIMVEWPEEELGVYAGKVAWDDLTTTQRRDKIKNEKRKLKKTAKWPEELGVYAGPPAWDELNNRQRVFKIKYARDKLTKTVKWPEVELGVYAGKVAWDDLVDAQRKGFIAYVREKLERVR